MNVQFLSYLRLLFHTFSSKKLDLSSLTSVWGSHHLWAAWPPQSQRSILLVGLAFSVLEVIFHFIPPNCGFGYPHLAANNSYCHHRFVTPSLDHHVAINFQLPTLTSAN